MAELKPRIASGYKVNSNLVAEEILRKMSLVNSARRKLGNGPGHIPPGPPHRR